MTRKYTLWSKGFLTSTKITLKRRKQNRWQLRRSKRSASKRSSKREKNITAKIVKIATKRLKVVEITAVINLVAKSIDEKN